MVKNRKEYITSYAGVVRDNKLYIVKEGIGLLIEYNLSDFSYKILAQIDMMKEKCVRIKDMYIIDNIIYMISENSWNVLEYHMDSGRFILNGADDDCAECLAEKAFVWKEKLWIMPCYVGENVRVFDIEKKQYVLKKSIGVYLNENGKSMDAKQYVEYIANNKGKIYAIVYESGYIVSIDMESDEYTLSNVGEERGLSSINYDGANYWLSFFDNDDIAKWCPERGILEEYTINKIERNAGRQLVRFVYERDDRIYIVPAFAPYMLILSKKTNEISKIEYPKDFKRINENSDRYQFYRDVIYDDKILLLPFAVNKLIVMDVNTNEVQFIDSKLNKAGVEKYILKEALKEQLIQEIPAYSVKEFIEYVTRENRNL